MDPLEQALFAIRTQLELGTTPLVVFDLDHTLFDNGPRSIAILKHLADIHGASHPALGRSVPGLSPDLPYDMGQILTLAGVPLDHAAHESLRRELGDAFFSSRFLHHDEPIAGAVDYVNEVYASGATVVYLTGRDRPGMHEGTLASLRQRGFPADGPRVHLFMKPDTVTRDWNYKAQVRHEIAALGTLVAFFDNEPANTNTFHESYPGIVSVLLDTKCSEDPPAPLPGVHRMPDFRRRPRP